MGLTNRFQAAHDNVPFTPLKTLESLAEGEFGNETALNADQPLEGGGNHDATLDNPAGLFAIDVAPETSEARWRRIAGQISAGGTGIWADAEKRRKDEQKAEEKQRTETQRMLLNIQIQQTIDYVRQENNKLIEDLGIAKKETLAEAERAEEDIKKADETIKEMEKNAIELSNDEKGFLSKDGEKFETENGEIITDPKMIAEAKQKKKQNPKSADMEDYDEIKKLRKQAVNDNKSERERSRDIEEDEKHAKERGQKIDDLETRLKTGKLTDEEKKNAQHELGRLKQEVEQSANKHKETAEQKAEHDTRHNSIEKMHEKVLEEKNELVAQRSEIIQTKILAKPVDKGAYESLDDDELAALRAAKEARATGTHAQQVDPVTLSDKVPDVKGQFTKTATGETTATAETPVPTAEPQEYQAANSQTQTVTTAPSV